MKKFYIISIMLASLLSTTVVNAQNRIQIGDYLQMGTYEGESIIWRCVDEDENGLLMLSDKILCRKMYDGAGNNIIESHGRGMSAFSRKTTGSNYWKDSNIRSWLNSNESAGNVTWYCGNSPSVENEYFDAEFQEKYYDKEAGFLSNFKDEELMVIKTVDQLSYLDLIEFGEFSYDEMPYMDFISYPSDRVRAETFVGESTVFRGQITVADYCENVTDRVFLLGINQLNNIYNNGEILGLDYLIGELRSPIMLGGHEVYKYPYWTRCPVSRRSSEEIADNIYEIAPIDSTVYFGHADWPSSISGIRPAFYIDNNVSFSFGNGTERNPYTVVKKEEKSIKVVLNGKELSFDQPPILDPAGRVLVPIRKIAEAMGDDVKWNQDLQTAFVEHKERVLIIPLYTDHLYMAYFDKPIEWRKYDLDVPSQVQNGRTLTPVRAFCESLGATVNWDDSTQTVYIECNGNYDYDSLSDESINGINMAYSIMREHNNISFEKYSEEIYAYFENSNSVVDNVAMSWGSGLFDGIVQLLSGEDATETAVKASLAQVISLLDDINRNDDNAEIINGIKFTKSGAEAVKAFSELPEENLRINNIDDLNKLSETVPELESLSKAIKATGIAVDVLAFSAEQSSYLLADYAQNIAYLDNIEKYFRATSAGNDLLYKVIDDMRVEYSNKWIHSLKSLRNEGIDKVLSALADKATFGVFGIVNFAKDLTNELTGLSTSAKGLKEFYASCILNVAFDQAYCEMLEDVSGIHFHSDEMIDMFNMQRAVKETTYMSMNKIANSVDEVSWDDRIDSLESMSYILWK